MSCGLRMVLNFIPGLVIKSKIIMQGVILSSSFTVAPLSIIA